MVIAAHADSKHKRVQASHYIKVNQLLSFLEQITPRHKEPCFIHTKQRRRTWKSHSAFIPSHPQLSAPKGGTWRTSPSTPAPARFPPRDPASALSTAAGALQAVPFLTYLGEPRFYHHPAPLPYSLCKQTYLHRSEEVPLPLTAPSLQRG